MEWGFYGRHEELRQLRTVFDRGRWFFVKITGRRRIGKTTLIQRALQGTGKPIVYVQIPDSAPAGVLSAVADAMDTFRIDAAHFPRPGSLLELARLVGNLARAGYIVALDEFQYFNRDKLREFTSHLQKEVDALSAQPASVPGGLLVLGSIHTEMLSILEDRGAPLYNRTTDELELSHLDIASVVELLGVHADHTPRRLLFLWSLFEGVPKFYRDCYEQNVLKSDRIEVLRKLFFLSSSPLRTEADNWFLKELHGRYDVVLKYVARHPGCAHGELVEHVRQVSIETSEQVGGYLKILIEKYRLIEKRLPIFAPETAKKGRYYVTDNFLRSWLAALANPISALNFIPTDQLVSEADQKLADAEGFGLEKLVATLYEERSRKGIGDFALSSRICGYWDRADTEIDLVALDEPGKRIRFGSCKRSADKLVSELSVFDGHIQRFLDTFRRFNDWTIERVSIAPSLPADVRAQIVAKGQIAQDLTDLTLGLLPPRAGGEPPLPSN